ncbi:MAG: hypothetical protein A2Z16_04475 [Chloroflexi bacterium RBG_16_54_18]|nr:MAG: hypothetical protein A2Z16_04475 [Chloroflexi bacterium RBG_16_54_18]
MKTHPDQVNQEEIPDAVILIDQASQVKGGSRSARRLFGYTKPVFSKLFLHQLLAKDIDLSEPLTLSDLSNETSDSQIAYARHKAGGSFSVGYFSRKIEDSTSFHFVIFLYLPDPKASGVGNPAFSRMKVIKTTEAERKLRKQIETLREVVRILISSLDPQVVLELILDHLQRVVEYDSASIMLQSGDSLSIVAQRKLQTADQLAIHFKIQRHDHIKEVVESRQPVIIPDTELDSRWESLPHSNYIRSWLGVPLIGKERVIGLLNLDRSRPWSFTQEDAELTAAFANHAAIAIENANLYLAARQAADRRAILHRVSQEIVAADLEAEEIYTAVHRAAAQLMPAEAFVIVLFDDEKQAFEAAYLIDRNGRIPAQTLPANRVLTAQIVSSGHSIYIDDTSEPMKLDEAVHFSESQPVRSILAVPMYLRGKVIGMISAQSYNPAAYSDEDQNLLEMLASYAAIALDNAALFKSIKHLAAIDSLTGIYNRRKLFELGRSEFHRARRFHRPLSILMFDIDHFKRVNDTFGHSIGDLVLSKFAQLLKVGIRDIDILGRYGGEEFLIILPETRKTTAVAIANRLRTQISATFKNMYDGSISLTASIGVVSMKDDTHSFTGLIEEVDNALYGAKNLGRDRIKVSGN